MPGITVASVKDEPPTSAAALRVIRQPAACSCPVSRKAGTERSPGGCAYGDSTGYDQLEPAPTSRRNPRRTVFFCY
jgi:hypothetical protein